MKNLLQFINPANTPQNTGGGTSHSSTVVTPVWKGSRPTVSRRSIDSQPKEHRTHTLLCKVLKYAAMILLALTLGVGNAWGTTQTIGFTTATCAKSASSGGERSLTNVTNLTVAHELVSTTSGALATYTTADKEFQFSKKSDKVYSRGGYKWNVNTGTTLGTTNNTVGYSVVVGSGYQFTIDSISFAIGATANMIYQVIIYQGSDTLYKSSQLTFTRDNTTSNPNHTLKVNGLSAQSALQNLTGTFYVRARFAFNSTGKYFFLPAFTVTGDLHEAGGGGGGNVAPSISAPTADSEAIYLLNAEASGLSVTASGTPDPSYQWYYKASKDATDSTIVGSATSSSYTPLTTSAYDRYYYCKVSNSEGSKVSKFFRVQVLEEALTPTTTFNDGSYIIEDWDLDLSSLFTSNSAGAVTYSITDAGTTGALLRADGKSLYATTAGSATVQASQAANGIYAAKVVTATVTVAADENLILKVRLTGSNGGTKTLSGSLKTGAVAAVQALASSSPYKLNKDFYAYVALTLPTGEYFQEGDSVVLDLSKTGQIYCGTLPDDGASAFPEGSVLLGTTTKKGSIEYYVLPNTLPANTSTIYTSRSSSTYNGMLTSMAVYRIPETPACAATVPGNISKGDLTDGSITLTADGSAETGDVWYWQSSATGEDKTGTSGATKTVNAAGTYYLRSYNTAGDCWSDAKSVEVTAADLLTAPTATFSDGAYVVGASALDLSTLWSSNSSGTVTYALKVASDDASVTTGAFSATKAGSYVVTASQAATSTYSAVEKEATITVTWPATGEATILYNVAVGTSNTALGTASTDDNSASISNLSNFTAAGDLTVTGLGAGKDGLSTKLQTLSAKDVSKYIYVTFDVASGKEFVLDSVVTYIVAVSNAKTIEVVMNDTEGTKDSLNYSQPKNSEAAKHVFDFTSSAKAYEGTVTLKLYAYGETDHYRLGQPLKICGTVATKVVKYDLSFAKGSEYASGTMATVKYAEGAAVTLPACTFTAPTGKEFDAWVVTKDAGGASVTVTDGAFTMPAEAVTATATWKDRPKHTDATLSALTVGGEAVAGFAAATEEYDVELPFGTFVAPTVAATATDASYVKSVVVTPASSTSGDATVVVTAEDGTTTKTYTVHFSVEESKNIELVWKTSGTRCGGTTTGSTAIKSNDASVSTYINQITFTNVEGDGDDGAEGSSLNVGKKAGNMFILTAKPGFAFQAMSFFAKIQDATCEYSLDGGAWTTLTSTKTDGDACYSDIFSAAEVHEFRLRSTGAKGVWIRNMQLTMIQACTSKTIAWTAEPAAEYELGISPTAIAASANNGTVSYASTDGDVIAVNSSNGALTLNALGTVTLSASVPGGDGAIYCVTPASVSKVNVKTYYLVTFDAQNETAVSTVKYYKNGDAIALPSTPEYSGYDFLGWFDAPEDGNPVTSAITPTASCTVYAQWEAKCTGPTITTQPTSANYFIGRTASALTCEATPGVEGKALTYTWYSCDDAVRTNSVELAGAPTPSTAAVGTFYYYCAVTEEDCDVIRNSNVVTINVTEKDMLLLIQANHVKGKTATISGYIGGTYHKEMQDNAKLGSKGNYFGIKLASGTFQAGDRVYVHTAAGADTNGDKVRIFKSNAASAENVLVEGTEAMVSPNGDNWVTLPATTLDSLYLRRGTDTENYNKDWNPYIDIFAVYRPYPVPVLTAMTVNGSAATITGTNVTATIAANAELASLTIVPTFMSNDPANTSGDVGGPWVENEGVYTNSYVVTDKDDDTNTYTITLTRDVEIASVTISGQTTVAAKSQITLTATVLPANVANKAVTWSSSDETKATVDANGVVTGKAEGSVTITATSVADNTKKGTRDITVTKFVGTERAYWFVYAADAAANGVENNSTVFGSAPTGSNNGGFELTLEEGWTVTTTKKTGSTSSFGTFTVPADFTATWYAAVKAGGDNRVLNMKQGDVVKYSVALTNATDPEIVKIENIAAGTYNVVLTGGSSISGAYLFAAELNSYPLTSVSLEEGFNLRLEQSRTPVFTITPAKAAVASQVWSEVSRTGASDATLNTSTGEITAGTEEGTLTVKVTVTDAFGNEAESGNCVVKIVNIIDQKDVTGSMTWNWTGAGTANVTIDNEEALVLGNYIDGDQWAYLKGTKNDYAYNTNNSGCYQGYGTLSFKTIVPGLVTITARRISNDADLKIGEDVVLSVTNSNKTSKAYFVPAGEVNIIADATKGMRILKIEFDAEPTVDKIEGSHFGGYTREVNPQYYGTVCLPKSGVMVGATVFQVAYMDYKEDGVTPYKVYYDQVENGTMDAGMPYIFLAEQSTIGVYYTSSVEETAKEHNGLHGTLEDMNDMSGTGIYMLYNNKVLHSTNHASYLNANRAYIQISEIPGYSNPGYMAPAPKYRRISTGFNGTNTATGMENVQGDAVQSVKVLIDGKMYILRGEKMFDATGRLVK